MKYVKLIHPSVLPTRAYFPGIVDNWRLEVLEDVGER